MVVDVGGEEPRSLVVGGKVDLKGLVLGLHCDVHVSLHVFYDHELEISGVHEL